MYVNLISAALQSYFDPHELSGQLLISAIAIAAAFIITLTLIYLLKRKWFVKVLAAALACFLVFSVVVIALSLSQDLKENAEDFQKYQTVFAIGTFSALAAGFALVVILKRAAGKYYKPVAISAAVVMAALTIAFFVISFINNASPLAESYALTQKSQLYLAITLFTAVLFGILIVSLTNTKTTTFEIVFAAVSIAMSFALSYIRIFKLPQGGSVTFASLVPIVIYSYKFGIRKGVLCCFIYGLLQSFQDPWIVHPLQYFLDYPLAFGAIGLSGFLRGKMKDSAAAGLGFFS
ncbi:MAG: energy-coupled thiamine transporter ThiT, partial [Christensenellales bacterium]